MYATVCAVDRDAGMVRLDILGRVTNWLPCVTATPAVGQQVAYLEFGNDGTGVVLGSLARTDGKPVTLHIGGIDITIDGSKAVVKSDVEITGNVKVDGDIELTGTVTDSRGDLTNFQTTDGASRA
jgi:phage baseplate assembly protein gpV